MKKISLNKIYRGIKNCKGDWNAKKDKQEE